MKTVFFPISPCSALSRAKSQRPSPLTADKRDIYRKTVQENNFFLYSFSYHTPVESEKTLSLQKLNRFDVIPDELLKISAD